MYEPFGGGKLLLVADVFVMLDNPGDVVWTQILILKFQLIRLNNGTKESEQPVADLDRKERHGHVIVSNQQ